MTSNPLKIKPVRSFLTGGPPFVVGLTAEIEKQCPSRIDDRHDSAKHSGPTYNRYTISSASSTIITYHPECTLVAAV
jgi:hypothetical protein